MPDIENSRKTAEKGVEWVPVTVPLKQLKNGQKNSQNSQNSCFSGVSAVVPAVFRVTHSEPFSAVFWLFSMSASGTSVDGHGDCNRNQRREAPFH